MVTNFKWTVLVLDGALDQSIVFLGHSKEGRERGRLKEGETFWIPRRVPALDVSENDDDYCEEFWLILWQEDSFENWLSLASFSFILF